MERVTVPVCLHRILCPICHQAQHTCQPECRQYIVSISQATFADVFRFWQWLLMSMYKLAAGISAVQVTAGFANPDLKASVSNDDT